MSYVYIKSEPQLYTVGFYDGGGHWQPDSDHSTRDAAADRVRWLNGGGYVSEQTIRHAAIHPRLVAALRELVLRCDGAEGVRADGSNIQTIAAHALLAELEQAA